MIAAEFNRRKGDFMDETYRIGEVVKGMGVGQYTLKHYERAGLVTPTPDEESGYRYYTYRDFGQLIYIRNLRTMGFTVEESSEYLSTSFEEMPKRLAAQERKNTAEIERLFRANEALTLRREALACAMKSLGCWKLTNMPALAFTSHFSGDQLNGPFRAPDDTDAWRERYEHADITMHLTSEALEDGSHPCILEWGIADLRTRSDCFQADGPKADGSPCLAGSFEVSREEDMTPVLSALVGEELRQRELHSTDAFFVHRAVRRDGDSFRLILSTYVPLS